MADSGRPVVFFNCATLMQPLSAETAAATLDEIAAFFAFADPSRQGEVLLVSAWPTGDLRPFGWSLMGHPPLFLLPAGAVSRTAPPDLRIEEVRDLEALHAWERVAIEGYPTGRSRRRTAGSLSQRKLARGAALAIVGGLGRGIARSVHRRPGPSTASTMSPWSQPIPDARGRGYGEALTWHAPLGPIPRCRRCSSPQTSAGPSTSEWAFCPCNASRSGTDHGQAE